MLLSNETSTIMGVHQTPIISQNERTDDLNLRIRSRQFPDFPLEPQFSFRPVSTKYTIIGESVLAKPAVKSNAPAKPYLEHNVAMNFNPATRTGPWKTYVRNIDTETVLRNNAHTNDIFVPNSDSDLYRDNTTVVDRPSEQPYELLFSKPLFSQTHNRWQTQHGIGVDRFNNSTRTQLRREM
jgi:hypothetical protein